MRLSKAERAPDVASGLALAALRPSEYTAALIHVLQGRADRVRGARVLEIGSGSGVVMAALAGLGAAAVCGVDIEEDAVAAGMLLLDELGHRSVAEFRTGDLWQPIGDRRFDLIVANLPHFPMTEGSLPGRRPTWTVGGPDGRRLLDRFLAGLSAHLVMGGRAFITHNAFVDLARSRALLAPSGLHLEVVQSVLVNLGDDKLARMTPEVLAAALGRTIHRYGPYAFGELHIVEIA
ncbi:MAG: methyltransferase domain-containing protein [Reyranellaceae bacterium]